MSYIVAIQMDHLNKLNFASDSTLRLAFAIAKQQHKLYHYLPQDMFLDNGILKAQMSDFFVDVDNYNNCRLGNKHVIELDNVDIILVRQDPPFDMPYLTSTYLLETLTKKTLIVNNPTEIRNCPEKLFVMQFRDLMPDTLITSAINLAHEFLAKYGKIVLKPIYAHGGCDVILVDNINNLNKSFQYLTKKYHDLIIVQEFIKNVKYGDKRIILVNGNPIAAINRIPQRNDFRSNMAIGGIADSTDISAQDKIICQRLKPILQAKGLLIAGIDIIDGKLTEINITSPTGIAAYNQLHNTKIEEKIWKIIESQYKG